MDTFPASTLNTLSQPGFAWVAGIKALGYFLFLALGPLRDSKPALMAAGALLRFGIGVGAGLGLIALGQIHRPHVAVAVIVLAVVRFVEWRILFALLARSIPSRNPRRDSLAGTGVSFLLDIPAILGWFGIQGGPF